MKYFLFAMLSLSFGGAFAADGPAATSQLEANQPFWSNVSLKYRGVLTGPSVGNGSSLRSGVDGNLTSKMIEVYNSFAIGYFVAPKLRVFSKAIWTWNPVRGQHATLYDPKIGISDSAFVVTKDFYMYLELDTYIPVSDYSQGLGLVLAPGSFQLTTTRLGSGFGIKTLSAFRFYMYDRPGSSKDFKLWLQPAITYQIVKGLEAELAWNNEYQRPRNGDFKQTVNAFEPGLSWKVTRSLRLNPYLSIPAENPTLKATTMMFQVFGTFL